MRTRLGRRAAPTAWRAIGGGIGLLVAVWAGPSAAVDWQWGELTGHIDSFLSFGFSLRTLGPDCRRIANIPSAPNNPGGCIDGFAENGNLTNSDDGNLNWDAGDTFSVVAKGLHEIQLDWRNFGTFVRFSYFGDAIQGQKNSSVRTSLRSQSRFRRNPLEGGVVGAKFTLLDAYAYSDFSVGERRFDVRFGNQVVNWGESTFTQGGINATNTIDVTKIRLPGSELREALLPAPIARVGGDIWGPLSFEAYYQLFWRETYIDPPGTFFSITDVVGRGAYGFFQPFNGDPATAGVSADDLFALGIAGGAPRADDEDARDSGQFGAALRYYIEQIETELSAYYILLHAKTPSVSFEGTNLTNAPGRIHYFRQFPEDVELVGMSFNTLIAGFAVGGEVSYRPNEPVPITTALPDLSFWNLLVGGAGGRYRGFVREPRIVGIVNAKYVAGPPTPGVGRLIEWIGASDMNLLVEFGFQSFPDRSKNCPPTPSGIPISPAQRTALGCIAYAAPLGEPGIDDTQGSYSLRLETTYNRVLGTAFTLKPIFTFRHDFFGVGPGNGALWMEGVKQFSPTLRINYLQRWTSDISYLHNFGAGAANPNIDRNFFAFSISYNF